MLEFEVLARGLYRPEQVEIVYDSTLRMPLLPDQREWMDALWQAKLALARERQTRLFDSQLFRLVEAASRPDGSLHLVLGDTSYKEYVTTREPEFALHHPREERGNAIGVCSVVETSDGAILLDKRQGVDVYVGRYHVIGGFFERGLDTSERPDPFQAITREIREETGIQSVDIREQYCLGAVYDLATPHAELCFLTLLNITLAEVYTRTPEEDEIKNLESLQVTAESLRAFILSHHGRISATGEPNLLWYGALRFGEEWYQELMAHIQA